MQNRIKTGRQHVTIVGPLCPGFWRKTCPWLRFQGAWFPGPCEDGQRDLGATQAASRPAQNCNAAGVTGVFWPGAWGLCAVSLGSRTPPQSPPPGPPLPSRGPPGHGRWESAQGRSELTRPDVDCGSLGVAPTPCRARGLDAPLPRCQALRVPSTHGGLRATPSCHATAPPPRSEEQGAHSGGTAVSRCRPLQETLLHGYLATGGRKGLEAPGT